MTHYMDADKLIEELARLKSDVAYAAENEDDFPVTHGIYLGLDRAIHSVEIFPTADVAPKSEVAREIFAEIDVCLERFINDISYSSGDLIYDLGEIKAKHIGDQNDGRN